MGLFGPSRQEKFIKGNARGLAEYLKNNKPPPGVHWHRQLSDNIGVRALVSRCYEVIGMAKACRGMRELRDKVAHHYGRQVFQFTLSLPMPKPKVD